jgi:CheY-like chemotaxis protein
MLRVIIADDEHVLADSLALVLSHFGYETTAVYSGEKAVEAAAMLTPDVVISDVAMGEMSGIEAGIQIRQMLPDCRVLLFSGQASTADLVQRATCQGHYFEIVSKPIHPKALLAYLSGSVRGSSTPDGNG